MKEGHSHTDRHTERNTHMRETNTVKECYLALKLGVAVGKPVHISLSRARSKDPTINFQEDLSNLIKNYKLEAEFDVPNAASSIIFLTDFLRRTLNLSMLLDAPKDKSRATASINWLVRQLGHVSDLDLSVRAYWPRRIPCTTQPLSIVSEDPTKLIPANVSELPVSLEVLKVFDIAGRFRGTKTFVEDVSKALPEFYEKVGQHLNKWIPKPPKIKKTQKQEIEADDSKQIANPFWLPPTLKSDNK